ncbi:N-acetyltransferase 13, isoform CRA_c [Basidiobolus meristosporus CBS 931.73]|uniref:N-acetyltransferase 13, isoform CRA_c n=1 Tax=Basidiobolus meristosporus CBS 931.73 TaxID=1314790 RepID=A0A1Y1YW29_9FUNG|nr:N-acetyltransferase 13, isoform CRA_c [Basidiobolus meristosporus CBS 931.73]|eukprot:ORY01927.1 N-acetyltransferase 13, isoform CRA_c [Basidiobolus meristosporus CBS 931.73]
MLASLTKRAAEGKASQTTASNNIAEVNKIVETVNPRNRLIGLGEVTLNNLGQLRRLNSILFPVHYSEKFYKDVLDVGEFAKLVYYNDACVGAVCCRKENTDGGMVKIYIMTLGILAPYRKLGLGSTLLEHILKQCEQDAKISELYLHVQISNEEAIAFYKKYGFEVTGTLENYYKNISPADAYILSKKVN